MAIVKIFLFLLIIGFYGFVGMAMVTSSISEEFSIITGFIWGKVTVTDLYLALIFFSCLVIRIHPHRLQAFLWAMAILGLGAPIALLYFLIHYDQLNISRVWEEKRE